MKQRTEVHMLITLLYNLVRHDITLIVEPVIDLNHIARSGDARSLLIIYLMREIYIDYLLTSRDLL